ncbi:peptidyl-prolyl cis-trans isomerase [Clostridiaceae bacterium]|nr:peptidyl-prolyl cis-trans isomerase [Clostridium sp.]NBI71814.1 peptidyl-prolyl cis-trans isomerase [Clostridiaceae bacterium]
MIIRRKAAGSAAVFLTAAFLTALLAGCKAKLPVSGDGQNVEGYSRADIMVIATTEQNRYEAVCTDRIWQVSLEERGETFDRYLTEQIRCFMDELKVMNLLAEKREIALTAEERAAMAEASQEYFGRLTDADISYMGVTRESVKSLFEDFRLAEKLVDDVTAGLDLEVSDSEAKMISIQQVQCASFQEAQAFAARVAEENADFEACALEADLSLTARRLGHGEETKAFEEAAFALASGQTSGPIESDSSFYVLKCLSDYDEEATDARKKMIFEERKRRAFQAIYDSFRETITLSYPEHVWEELSLGEGNYGAGADFFEIYREYVK